MNIVKLIGYLITPVSKIVSLMNEVQEVRRENAELKAGQQELLAQIEALKTENRELNELVKAPVLPVRRKRPRKRNPKHQQTDRAL